LKAAFSHGQRDKTTLHQNDSACDVWPTGENYYYYYVSTKQDLLPLLLLMTGSAKASVQLSIYPPSRIQWNLAIILAQSEMCLYHTVGTQI